MRQKCKYLMTDEDDEEVGCNHDDIETMYAFEATMNKDEDDKYCRVCPDYEEEKELR
ncbi:MAG: hypothetical protein FWH42_01450 [Dehalococcoidia bacterium]|nr:hypothetical protein [Dehalococcoidia bacterium]